MYYAGIGSRATPDGLAPVIHKIAGALSSLGYTLRSGAAAGADAMFEAGCDAHQGKKEIFLPWRGFNNNQSLYIGAAKEAMSMAAQHHPNWHGCSQGAQKLLARNVHQILGPDLKTPVDFVICWTADGCEGRADRTAKTGGTGLAIALADSHGIPVINLARPGAISRIEALARMELKLA